MKAVFFISMCCLMCLTGNLYGAGISSDFDITIHPEHISIDAGFNGTAVTITGQIPSNADALIRITGKPEHSRLKQKGRVLGILWMNLGSVEVANVPDLFLLYLPEETEGVSWSNQPVLRNLGLGLEGVRKQAEISGGDNNKDALFDEFVKLKQKSGRYAVLDNSVHYGQNDGKMKSFTATLPLPSTLPEGTYQLETFVIEDGAVTASATREIDAGEVGLPSWISTLAFDHGTLYGVLAVLVALMAGLLTGILFKGEKGAH